MKVVKFMTSPAGRGLRIVVGIVVMSLGLLVIGGTVGTITALVGIVPIAGGVLDFCIISAVLGYGLSGAGARGKNAGKSGHTSPPQAAV